MNFSKTILSRFAKLNEEQELICQGNPLARLDTKIKNDKSFALLSAFRGARFNKDGKKQAVPFEQNFKNSLELGDALKSKGYQYFIVDGKYVQQDIGPVKEMTLFVQGPKVEEAEEFIKLIISLGKKYDQDSVIYKDAPEHIVLYNCRTNEVDMEFKSFKEIDFDKAEFGSKFKHGPAYLFDAKTAKQRYQDFVAGQA